MPEITDAVDKDRLREGARKSRLAVLRQRTEKNEERHVYAPQNLSDLDIGQIFERVGA